MQNRRFTRLSIFIAALICFGFIFSPAVLLAEDVKISAGLGLAFVPDYEGSDDNTAAPALLFNAKWDNGRFIKLSGNSVRGNVLPNKMWSLGPVLQYRAKRNDDVESNRVGNMKTVDAAVEGGAFVGFNDAGWDAKLQWVADISDSHDGTLGTLKGGYSFKDGDFTTRVGASMTYADDDYMKTYFSVNTADSGRSGLSEYSADGGMKDVGADLTVNYAINQKWAVVGMLGYKALLNDAKDSPVVDDAGNDSQTTAGFLVVYNF